MAQNTKAAVWGGMPIFDEIFTGSQWTCVNPQQLLDSFKFFDADPNVRTGFDFRMNALLNGGIIFKRKNRKLKGDAKAWIVAEFTKFLRDVVRNYWCAGYAACIWKPHPLYGGRPTTIDLTQVTTKYQFTRTGEPIARYFYQSTNRLETVEITNVITFWHSPPDQVGNLRSIIPLLAQDHMHELILTYYSLVATKGRAMPVMITEKEKESYDRDNIRAPAARSPDDIRTGKTGGGVDDDLDGTELSMQMLNNTADFMNRTQHGLTDTVLSNLTSLLSMPHFAANYQLSQGRTFKPAPLPDGPKDLLAFRIARQERAYSLMGVPLAMVTNATSTGGKTSRQGENSNSFILFDNSQAALKQELINVGKQMYYNIHLKAHIQEYLDKEKPENYNTREMAEAVEVSIELPSIPNEEKLQEWFKNGWFKYDRLIEHLSSKHGVDLDNFNEKPELSVEELAGNFPPPPQKNQPPAKKAKK